jgi:NAD(P)-dependent dehydrogenase (short-subunit alcohol dehydrogenase family)
VQDRVMMITGGFGALGRAVAQAAIARGAQIALVDRAPISRDEGLLARADRVLCLPGADLATHEGAERAVEATFRRFGQLHAVVNVAGGFRWQTIGDGDPAEWCRLFEINVLSALYVSRASLPHLKRANDARIVNIGAGAAVKAQAGMGAYAAAKSGVHRLTESLAEELKASGVTVNAVLPSILDTPANRAEMPSADFSTWVSLPDIAEVILFLCSPAARAVTGALIPVNGRV